MTPPSSNFLLELILAASLVGNLVLLFIRIFGRGEKHILEPQPLVVTEATKFMTKDACRDVHAAQNERITKVEHNAEQAALLAGESRKTMYQKMDAMRDSLTSDIARVHARVDDLQAEVRTIPSTVVRMIKEAREI